MSDYEILKAAGHSAAKAAEIMLDVQRGDAYALAWLAATKKRRGGSARRKGRA